MPCQHRAPATTRRISTAHVLRRRFPPRLLFSYFPAADAGDSTTPSGMPYPIPLRVDNDDIPYTPTLCRYHLPRTGTHRRVVRLPAPFPPCALPRTLLPATCALPTACCAVALLRSPRDRTPYVATTLCCLRLYAFIFCCYTCTVLFISRFGGVCAYAHTHTRCYRTRAGGGWKSTAATHLRLPWRTLRTYHLPPRTAHLHSIATHAHLPPGRYHTHTRTAAKSGRRTP